MTRLIAVLFALIFMFAVVECRSEELPRTVRGPPPRPKIKKDCKYADNGLKLCRMIGLKAYTKPAIDSVYRSFQYQQ
ncbi:hypothetical protein QR680_014572 [Steinernema hermaphroditum]|uniref:Uncharacterized protein n=1 Tax=Steinernema hermaphroditum TaxID=289476 RepID=A0AA39M457_9BILA|nr:hypothetical protein QR680_014572 [Steinernema hermaphroditum]